jgi:hypothetical protein
MELIRKIIIGQNPKDAMAGIRRYLVYIYNENEGTMLWKTIDDMPVLIEHDCEFR